MLEQLPQIAVLALGVSVGVGLSRLWCWLVRRHFPEEWQW
jgi:hypothetical protein